MSKDDRIVGLPEVGGEIAKRLPEAEVRWSRLSVVDGGGLAYEKRGVRLELVTQDEGRTLKIFVRPEDE